MTASHTLQIGLLVVTSLLLTATLANPVFVDNPSLAQFQSGRNIRHLPCIVRKSGRSGVCMFAIDCIKQNGTHLGTCIDRFYFGSCCALKDEASLFAPDINDNSIDQNTISHFSHESTTLPTSALFKLTTESSTSKHHQQQHHQQQQQQQNHANELLKNVTQSYLSTSKPMISASTTTIHRTTPAQTTHKPSHFVVRTTVKPVLNAAVLGAAGKPTTAPTTVKPPRRRTTTSPRPVHTTAPAIEQRIETTTAPTKFVTFQIVETTTPPVTEPSSSFETTTRRHTKPTRQRVPITTATSMNTTAAKITTTTTRRPTTATLTTVASSTTRPTPPLRTTTTTKPQKTHSSRRPTPAKKPAPITTTTTTAPISTATMNSKQPLPTHSRPTRRPIESGGTSSNATATETATTIAAPARRPAPAVATATSDDTSTTFTETKQPQRPTHAPRPRPQPTADIVKVPAVLADAATTPATTKATRRPTKTPSTTTTTTTVETKKQPSSSSGTTTTTKPTRRHTTTVSSTKKPGLITWTDVDAEPHTNATVPSAWQPADWIPLPTLVPHVANKTTTTTTTTAASNNSMANATDKVIISVATSVSTSESKPGASNSTTTTKPHRTTKPTKTTTTTKATTTTTAAASAAAGVASTSGSIEELESSTLSYPEMSTESYISTDSGTGTDTDTDTDTGSGTGSSTVDYSGTGSSEDYNTTAEAGSTTVAPSNALEGVDYREVCGRRMFPEPRIVGGANAAFGRWPWQISLRQWRTSTYLHKCGAALLNENWAITAAHCVDNVPPSDLLLRLGEYDLAEEEEPYGYQERRVQIVASHPQFDPRTFEYDLALLRFYEPVVFQPNIIPVCVPENDENFIGQTAFVTGWGRLYEDGPLPSVLQEVAVPVINNTICESMYRVAGYIEHIPHIFICAGWKKGGYDSCEGDSGGPMVLQREKDKRFQLGGVISWGIGCAEANQPGVYTRISEFRDWINQILQF
ncbi:serine proteinase stubble [Scaptodrosophila lebanonensis]|uniref:Serine proteinase stubble n=1 Tax=Drosophila lebanonensis TaxID=7225 RepID=A0A6J2SY77_DROLE|nr:serine proteinase stubble [Scaptodrosophila lebanonensis]